MIGGAAEGRPQASAGPWRGLCLIGAAVAVVLTVAPPLLGDARRSEYGAALQFSLFAIAIPALVAVGAPWRRLGLAARDGEPWRTADRVGDRRLRHRELPWTLIYLIADMAVVVAWRTPTAVSTVARHGWVAPLEGISLVVVGTGLWLELVFSPPLVPRSGPLRRTALAAVAMWFFWIDAYIVGLSNSDWYRSFHHVAGHGLSAAADQQVAAVILWFVAACAFVPVIFWNALTWIRSDDDPDAELLRLNIIERRRAVTPPGPPHGGGVATS
jgi:cytochrome c oxidase assembly factor CtaG